MTMRHLWKVMALLIPVSVGWLLWSGVPVRALLNPWTVLIAGATVLLLVWQALVRDRMQRRSK